MVKLTDLYNTTENAHLERIEELIRRNFTPRYYVALGGAEDPAESYYNVADNEDDFITDIHEWIGCLAIKDGVDAVRYNNGNFGFVAYYSGREDYMEIIPA